MPEATRLGDIGLGHDCHFPATTAITGSPDVDIDSTPAVRQGDAYESHTCPTCPGPSHPRNLSGGSSTVFINGMSAGRVGDAIDCGGSADVGSETVYIGG